MPDDPGLLAQIGIRVPALFAGLAGGIVGAWADQKAGLATWAGAIVCGGLTANWFAEPATRVIPGLSATNEGLAGFIVGACAYGIIKTIKIAVSAWSPKLGGGNP